MLFSSPLFIVWYLPIFILAYLLVPKRLRNHTAFAGSFVFYAWGAPIFCLVLLVSATFDLLISRQLNGLHARRWLTLGVSVNILTLFVFKYFNFFIDNARIIVEGLGMHFPTIAEIALPLGISFFTFQKVSYLVDVYRKHTSSAQSWVNYVLFVFLFPQLIAGPIVRYKDLSNQINDRSDQESFSFRLAGLQRFVLGLTKKVLIADALAPLADLAFSTGELGSLSAIIGLLAYTFQIYYDFSGYSDMAIGLGMIMGFRFPENFDWPYVARGFRSFWRKWHMTLSTWMRDYLYIPLGGSQTSKWIVFRNLWVVFLLSGLWHGASWHFIIWGAWHGLFIIIDRYTSFFRGIGKVSGALLTFALVALGWIWFRAPSLDIALNYFGSLINFSADQAIEVTSRQWFTLAIATIFAFLPPGSHNLVRGFHGENNQRMLLKTVAAAVLLLVCLGQIATSESQPFIYFRF